MALKGKLLCFCTFVCLVYGNLNDCNKVPSVPKNKNVGGRYLIEIPGHPKTYVPGQKYSIFLKTNPRVYPQKAFKDFILTIESDENEGGQSVGHLNFEYESEILAKISTSCPNTVIQSSEVPKTEIQVYWTAPPSGNGCIKIKATVVESKDNWFSEDEGLTKRLCEESLQNEDMQPPLLEECCACDEAKYQIEFEGKWTRNTHYRHFPSDQWKTKFSYLIGASHQYGQAFWNYEDIASDGLQELARSGITTTLEAELKHNIENIRTIIKAPGPQYPNITQPTSALFRVDKRNHLVSFVIKMIPSPDWIVGVSNLELCKSDCTWEETRILNLYPWDVGIDNGLQYDSSDPVSKPQPIRKITPNNPNDPRSPFYSEDGEEMKPIAKLYITRQRVYPKSCDAKEEEGEIDCSKREWSNWTNCSVNCGTGLRVRHRLSMSEKTALQCGLSFLEQETCSVEDCSDDEDGSDKETITEAGVSPEAEADVSPEDPSCPGTRWGPWTPCSVTCGKGKTMRRRIYMQADDDQNNFSGCEDDQERTCDKVACEESSPRSPYLEADNLVTSAADGDVINCKVSSWSRWSPCNLERRHSTCGEGYSYKTRTIKVHQSNGGKPCPKKLQKRQRCVVPCPETKTSQECLMGPWSSWTPCTSNCGNSAVQIRTREILYKPPDVDECPANRVETKPCHLPLACSDGGQPILK